MRSSKKSSLCTRSAGTPEIVERLLRGLDHVERPAHVPLVDPIDVDQTTAQRAQFPGVDPAFEQRDLVRLAAEDVDHLEAGRGKRFFSAWSSSTNMIDELVRLP